MDSPLLCELNYIQSALASLTNWLGRLMRHIGAMGYIEEVAADTYKPTNFSSSLTIPIIGDGYPCM